MYISVWIANVVKGGCRCAVPGSIISPIPHLECLVSDDPSLSSRCVSPPAVRCESKSTIQPFPSGYFFNSPKLVLPSHCHLDVESYTLFLYSYFFVRVNVPRPHSSLFKERCDARIVSESLSSDCTADLIRAVSILDCTASHIANARKDSILDRRQIPIYCFRVDFCRRV
jgi:hypothetical protein